MVVVGVVAVVGVEDIVAIAAVVVVLVFVGSILSYVKELSIRWNVLALFHLIENSVPLADAVSIGMTVVVLDTVVVEATVLVGG